MVLLLALTGRTGAAIVCLLPCAAPPLSISNDGDMPPDHCGAAHGPEGVSGSETCRMAHGDSDPATLRTGERLTVLDAPVLHASIRTFASTPLYVPLDAPAALLLRAAHPPPGKPLPLRV